MFSGRVCREVGGLGFLWFHWRIAEWGRRNGHEGGVGAKVEIGKREEEEGEQTQRRRGTNVKKNGREPCIKLKLLKFKDESATKFTIFTKLPLLYKQKQLLLDNRLKYCVVKNIVMVYL